MITRLRFFEELGIVMKVFRAIGYYRIVGSPGERPILHCVAAYSSAIVFSRGDRDLHIRGYFMIECLNQQE